MGQMQQVGRVATAIVTENGTTSVYYHGTPVVRFGGGQVTLDTGGWFTATTKARMNQAANQYNLGFVVYQKAGKWFAALDGKDYPFDGNRLVLPLKAR